MPPTRSTSSSSRLDSEWFGVPGLFCASVEERSEVLVWRQIAATNERIHLSTVGGRFKQMKRLSEFDVLRINRDYVLCRFCFG